MVLSGRIMKHPAKMYVGLWFLALWGLTHRFGRASSWSHSLQDIAECRDPNFIQICLPSVCMLPDACCPPRHTKFSCQLGLLVSRSHESGSPRKRPLRWRFASWKLLTRFCQDQSLWPSREGVEAGLDKGRSWAMMH